METATGHFVWHYTVGSKLEAIARTKALAPAKPVSTDNQREVLWFSRRQTWEPSASKIEWPRGDARRSPSIHEVHARQGLYRFGLARDDARLLPWPSINQLADIDMPEAMTLVATGLRCGANPTDWLGTLNTVPLADLRFEAWDGTQWVEASLHERELAYRMHIQSQAPRANRPHMGRGTGGPSGAGGVNGASGTHTPGVRRYGLH